MTNASHGAKVSLQSPCLHWPKLAHSAACTAPSADTLSRHPQLTKLASIIRVILCALSTQPCGTHQSCPEDTAGVSASVLLSLQWLLSSTHQCSIILAMVEAIASIHTACACTTDSECCRYLAGSCGRGRALQWQQLCMAQRPSSACGLQHKLAHWSQTQRHQPNHRSSLHQCRHGTLMSVYIARQPIICAQAIHLLTGNKQETLHQHVMSPDAAMSAE